MQSEVLPYVGALASHPVIAINVHQLGQINWAAPGFAGAVHRVGKYCRSLRSARKSAPMFSPGQAWSPNSAKCFALYLEALRGRGAGELTAKDLNK